MKEEPQNFFSQPQTNATQPFKRSTKMYVVTEKKVEEIFEPNASKLKHIKQILEH